MRKALSVLVLASIMSVSIVSAADLPLPVTDASASGTTSAPIVPELTAAPNPTAVTITPELSTGMNAAPSAGSSSLGEYKSVACSSNSAFTTNSCDQCFVGGSISVGGDLNGIFDNWTNNTTNMLIGYKDEQKLPNMVSFGSTWNNTPTDLAKFWKNSSDIVWSPTGSGGRMNYILQPGQKVRFIESEMGARYVLEKTEKKDGEMVGMIRFPVVSHVADKITGSEGTAKTHYECVSYMLSAPVITPPQKPVPPVTPPTKVETGPETLILILAAFFIAFGMMFSLRKRS